MTDRVGVIKRKLHLVCAACGYGVHLAPDRVPACSVCRMKSWDSQ